MKRVDLVSHISNIGHRLFVDQNSLKNHPVLHASCAWRIVSDQLKDLLGREVHRQWFKNISPVVVSQEVIILSTPNRQSCLWITTHYQELVDLLLTFQDKNLSSFFVSKDDVIYQLNNRWHEVQGIHH